MKIIRIDKYRLTNDNILDYLHDIPDIDIIQYHYSDEYKCVFALIEGEVDVDDININITKEDASMIQWNRLKIFIT